jgi:hypothetical protein
VLGVLKHQEPHPFERRHGGVSRYERLRAVLGGRHRAQRDGDGQSDEPAIDAHDAFSISPPAGARGPRRLSLFTHIARTYLRLIRAARRPLPSRPPDPYIAVAVRKDGYGDKWASE